MDAAIRLVDARAILMARFDQLAQHSSGQRIARQLSVQFGVEDTGLNPDTQVASMFVAAAGISRGDHQVVVVKYLVPSEQMRAMLEAMAERTGGRSLDSGGLNGVRVLGRSGERVYVMAGVDLLIVLPTGIEDIAQEAFAGPIELRDSIGPEAMRVSVTEPSVTLGGYGGPSIPSTISNARAKLTFRQDGGADISAEGQSTSAEQAQADAMSLTHSVESATTVRISVVQVRMFPAVVFRAEEDTVKSDVSLSADELRRLLVLSEMALRR